MNGNRVVPRGRKDRHEELIDAFRNFVNATVLMTDTESQELMTTYTVTFVENIFNYFSIPLPFSAPRFSCTFSGNSLMYAPVMYTHFIHSSSVTF